MSEKKKRLRSFARALALVALGVVVGMLGQRMRESGTEEHDHAGEYDHAEEHDQVVAVEEAHCHVEEDDQVVEVEEAHCHAEEPDPPTHQPKKVVEERGRAGKRGEGEVTVWTCSMHPQFKLPKSGKCPICFMDLIPLSTEYESEDDERVVRVSEAAKKLLQLETAAVERRAIETEIRLLGRVDYDETRVSYIAARVAGRLDKLYVNYTGMRVRKGDKMAEIYSPELMAAQEELLQALKLHREGEGGAGLAWRGADGVLAAARGKLSLLGLTEDQIGEIERVGEVRPQVVLYAAAEGVVVAKGASEGMYVAAGERIFTVADLSTLWVKLEAYESDLARMRVGAPVEFTAEAYPGRKFVGEVSFVDAVVDALTRTARVRVAVENADLALKPGMFARAVVRARVGGGGADGGVLVVPASAVLKTGRRAVVYRQVPNSEKPTYEGKVITLGERAGAYYVVEEGLEEGDRVVTRGAFMLDAEMQIRAKPSMMSGHDHG